MEIHLRTRTPMAAILADGDASGAGFADGIGIAEAVESVEGGAGLRDPSLRPKTASDSASIEGADVELGGAVGSDRPAGVGATHTPVAVESRWPWMPKRA